MSETATITLEITTPDGKLTKALKRIDDSIDLMIGMESANISYITMEMNIQKLVSLIKDNKYEVKYINVVR